MQQMVYTAAYWRIINPLILLPVISAADFKFRQPSKARTLIYPASPGILPSPPRALYTLLIGAHSHRSNWFPPFKQVCEHSFAATNTEEVGEEYEKAKVAPLLPWRPGYVGLVVAPEAALHLWFKWTLLLERSQVSSAQTCWRNFSISTGSTDRKTKS